MVRATITAWICMFVCFVGWLWASRINKIKLQFGDTNWSRTISVMAKSEQQHLVLYAIAKPVGKLTIQVVVTAGFCKRTRKKKRWPGQ